MDDHTRQFGGPERPRQHFPDQRDYDQQYAQYEPYDQPYRPAPEPKKSGGGAGTLLLGILLALAVLAGIVLFFLWRGAAQEANQPPPPPVTVTETSTTTEEAPLIPTNILPRDSDGNVQLPSELPTAVPTEVPPEVSQGANDVQQWIDGLISDLEGQLQRQ